MTATSCTAFTRPMPFSRRKSASFQAMRPPRGARFGDQPGGEGEDVVAVRAAAQQEGEELGVAQGGGPE